jgi:GTP-binding protein
MFVVDAQVGPDDTDISIARDLQKAKKPYVLVANKSDNEALDINTYEFMKLGLGEPMAVSAANGRGIGDLLDEIVAVLPPLEEEDAEESDRIRVAVLGRPNVGKSSFINALTGQPRAIVTPIAGTTRDAVDSPFDIDGRKYTLIDTAGLRRKYKVHENVEFYTTLRTMRAIDDCDVAIVLIDAADGLTAQDMKVIDEVLTHRRSAVLAVNKWDLIEKDSATADRMAKEIKEQLAQMSFLPLIFVSSLSGQRVLKVLDLVDEVYAEMHRRIPTAELNAFLERIVARKHPPARQGKYIKLNYMTQTEISPPTFIVFSNNPTMLDKSYVSYISNQIRKEYGFTGVPFRLKFKRK